MSRLDQLALHGIGLYQRFISPRKGFHCAYGEVHGDGTCSSRVHDIIRTKGLFNGWPDIRGQALACHTAAESLSGRQSAALDCDIGGCLDVGGVEGCFGGFGSRGGGGGGSGCDVGGCFIGGGRRRRPIIYTTVLILLTIALSTGYWTHGRLVKAVEVRLVSDTANEDRDRKWGFVENSELPDYQVIAYLDSGPVESRVAHNRSAREWVRLEFEQAFQAGRLGRIAIANRQLLGPKILEEITVSGIAAAGTDFKYRLIRNWRLF